VMLLSVSGAAPELVSVIVCAALVTPTGCEAKVRVVGEGDATGTAPDPARGTLCGEPLALSAMLMEATAEPEAVGAKLTMMLQLAEAASVLVQVDVSLNSAEFVPVIPMLVRVSGAAPELVSVMVCMALVVPIDCAGKVRNVALRESVGTVPVPLRATVCGESVALFTMLTAAAAEPDAVGVNVTLMVQLAATARLAAQLLIALNSAALVPVSALLPRVSSAAPELVSVIVCATLVVPTGWALKVSVMALSEAEAAAVGAEEDATLELLLHPARAAHMARPRIERLIGMEGVFRGIATQFP